jgi:hypothetical protein
MRSLVRPLAIAMFVMGCPAPQNTDKPRPDSSVDVFTPTPTPPAPPPPESKIGTVGAMDPLAADGKCSNERIQGGFTAVGSEVSFTSTSPDRVIKVGVGEEGRAFRPRTIEITSKRGGGVDEIETLYAYYGPDGALHGGNRQYYKSDESVRERRDIQTDEGAAAGQLALQVMERCATRR